MSDEDWVSELEIESPIPGTRLFKRMTTEEMNRYKPRAGTCIYNIDARPPDFYIYLNDVWTTANDWDVTEHI